MAGRSLNVSITSIFQRVWGNGFYFKSQIIPAGFSLICPVAQRLAFPGRPRSRPPALPFEPPPPSPFFLLQPHALFLHLKFFLSITAHASISAG